jgi:hypothetical protein
LPDDVVENDSMGSSLTTSGSRRPLQWQCLDTSAFLADKLPGLQKEKTGLSIASKPGELLKYP